MLFLNYSSRHFEKYVTKILNYDNQCIFIMRQKLIPLLYKKRNWTCKWNIYSQLKLFFVVFQTWYPWDPQRACGDYCELDSMV